MLGLSDNPLNNPRRAIAVGLIVLSLLAVAELSFRVFMPFWDRLAEARARKMDIYGEMLRAGQRYDHVLIGSSTTFMGIDPALVDRETGQRSFNAGQLGYTPINLTMALAREVVAAGVAKEVVYVIDSWVANLPETDRQTVDRHGRSDHFLWLSSVHRNRAVFAYWLGQLARRNVIHPQDAWRQHLMASRRFSSYEGVEMRPRGYLETFGSMDAAWPDYIRPKPVHRHLEQELLKMVRLCADAKVGLTIIRPPEHERTFTENRAAHDSLSAFLEVLGREHQVKVIDFTKDRIFDYGDAALFFDIHHVNSKGAVLLSQEIGRRLAAQR
jgi:hypothetical protein